MASQFKLQKTKYWALVPITLFLLLFYLGPVFVLLQKSMTDGGSSYNELLSASGVYGRILWITLKISVEVTIFCFLLGYPYAYYLTRLKGFWNRLAWAAVIFPFWTNILIRTYGWRALLDRRGVLHSFLLNFLSVFGVTDLSVKLVYSEIGTVIGLTHWLLPYMILVLYGIMRRIDPEILRAAQNLGADATGTFIKVFFPLSFPGVLAGCTLVFSLAFGAFITPALLGGIDDLMAARVVGDLLNEGRIPFAAAFSLVLFLLPFGIIIGMSSLLKQIKLTSFAEENETK